MLHNKNISIQIIRIVAMFMIIFDHILCKISFPLKAEIIQVLNSGVCIFLLISGYLYGDKKNDNWKQWYIKRFIRIGLPMWIFMVIDFAIEAIVWKVFDIKYIFIYAFNLQGILGVNVGGTNLWFLTLIMICYLITPILQWIKSKNLSRIIAVISIVATIILQIILSYTTDIGMVAGHTLSWCVIAVGMYVVGYFAGNIILSDKISFKRIGLLTMFTTVSSLMVLLFNQMFDGQIIYDRIVIYYGVAIVDLWIVTVVYKIGTYIRDGIWTKVINHLDAISYEFYIVHGLIIAILAGPLINKVGVVGYILGIIIISFIAAWVLRGICACIYNLINHIQHKKSH